MNETNPSADANAADQEILDRIKQRDVAAHRVLFERYYRRVFGLVRRRLDDDSLAEEVVADVFFEVWRSAESFRGASRVSTWLFGIAHFKALQAVRQRSSKARQAVIPTKVEELHRFAGEDDPGGSAETREALRAALAAIAALPASQREPLQLALLEGWSYAEIADHLGVSENTIKTRVSRGRARLRSQAHQVFTGLNA